MAEKTTEIKLPYGETVKTIHVPEKNLAGVLETRQHPGLENEWDSILSSLRNPTGSKPLIERINENDSVVIIVTDNTRACPEDRMLPPVLEELKKKIPQANITIIFALGLHPPLDRAQMEKKLGKDIVDNFRILNHDVNDCVNFGTTSRGTPIDVNRRVVEADFRISTGFIEPHFFAGFSGGRKSIAPGVFSVRSAYKNHSRSMLEHPLSKTGILKGNPVHEDMIEIARAANLDFIVNVLLNKKGEITHVVAGDLVQAHEQGCEMAKEINGARLDGKADITITTNSGAPLDLDLYQSVKGMETASHFTRDGGIIIICSSCYDGAGPEEFVNMHRTANSPQEILASISDEHPTGVQWQNQILANIQRKNDIYVVSDMDDTIIRDMMMTPFPTFENALEDAFRRLSKDASIAVIPEGPLVIPISQ
ncbi:MAG: nickel-dependent lactate racemase [Dehalococcoidales bacterium]|nr:MAG: nickel-dependent lactate racemase [Dehalococcoidales bacterium]